MNQFYDPYFKKFGIRKPTQLMSPVLPSTQLMELPLLSIYHYLGSNNGVDVAPKSNEYLFRNIKQPIAMEHILTNGANLGSPQTKQLAITTLIHQYHTRNRRYMQVRNIAAYENTGKTLVVENYGFIADAYKYQRNVLTEYYKWYNQQAAVWTRMAELANESARHQFIKVQLPTTLPSLSDLKIASMKVNSTTIHHVYEPDAFFILEMYKWLGDQRNESLIAKIPFDKLSRINIIFEESGRWLLVNLGVLDSWRIAPKEELATNKDANNAGMDTTTYQRRFLRMLMTLFQARSVDGKMMEAEGSETKKDEGGDEATLVKPSTDLPKVGITGKVTQGTQSADITPNPEDILNADKGEDNMSTALTADQERHLEADLAELERISKAVAERRLEVINNIVEDDELATAEKNPVTAAKDARDNNAHVFVPPAHLRELAPIDTPHVEGQPIIVDHTRGVKKIIDRQAENGLLSAAEARRYAELAKKHETIPAPDGKGSMKDFVVIHPDVVKVAAHKIPDRPSIIDKSMLESTLHVFDSKYIEEVFQKDVAAMVLKIQDAGICVTDYEVEHVSQITGDFDTYTCRVTPIEGAPSTLRWKLPSLRPDGVYISNGVPYRQRKQTGDFPIRKLKPDLVGMTSYYGKIFLSRSAKKVNDYGDWIRRNVMAMGLDDQSTIVTGLLPANVFDPAFACPRLYSTLAMGFRGFVISPAVWPVKVNFHSLLLTFDHTKRDEILEDKTRRAQLEKNGTLLIGVTDKKDPIVMMKDGSIQVVGKDAMIPMPSIETLLGLDAGKAPDEFVELKVLGQTIPLGVILGYEWGLANLLARLRVTPRRVPAGKRVNLLPTEYSLVFADETLVFEKKDKFAGIILAGFQEYHRGIRQYSVYEFDKRGVYLNVLETQGIGARYLREVDLLNQLWVDPITRELLVEMKEPVEFQQLLLRAAELLMSDQHPRPGDASFQRRKGYERMAGAVYSELVTSIRKHNGKPGKSKLPIDLNPFDIWKNISEDPSKSQVKDINPIENLKQQEAVTYSGVGGRNSRSMVKSTRAYDQNDMGVISESTVDSSDVAVNTYTSANPMFVSLRGVAQQYEIGKSGNTSLLSTSALTSVGADRDDPKRVNFIAIQAGHGVACHGYHANAVRTGYEQVIAHRTSDLFATTAKKPGKVLTLDDRGITVEYDDGTKQGIELGRRFGNAEGATIPHEVRAAVKLGQKFKVGDILAYNEGFFEPDFIDPSQVVWKPGVTVKVALMESPLTLEDSSAISQETAALLRSKTTKIREIIVDFKQSVSDLVKVGQAVASEDILCTIEDETTARNDLFDKESRDTLRVLSAQTPLAKAIGTVERIEVYYHGEKEDMSESLRALASASDREFSARFKAVGKPVMTGQVDESYRSDGDSLNLDTLSIKIYITSDVAAGVGDKGVFANQMKTVFGQVLEHDVTTEHGDKIGAIFGAKSIQARIVHSPDLIGTTTTLLDVLAERVVKAYRGK
ncbi:MAG: hypothetical protein P4L77_11290 [Sulfuriferula sp.]|nr:hypothetical protein [Sulfuriferula sp.]